MNTKAIRTGGFSLVEVLVALVVIAIGMLGIAKIQALAFASTGTSSARSLAAIQAASLAAAMRANRGYWSIAETSMTAPITIAGTTITSADATLATPVNCTLGGGNDPCTGVVLAAYDLQQWAAALSAALPADAANVNCSTASLPINCTISVMWNEKAVSINTTGTAANGNATIAGQQTYTLYVEP